jgi:predicted lipoprotein with Yx(FWY)xxD motif
MHKLFQLALFATATATVLFAAPGTSASGPMTRLAKRALSVRITTRNLPKLGTVLVNSKGRTLYMFVPDKRKTVSCVRA